MFKELEAINQRPKPFAQYTAATLWTDPHISRQMLKYHLDSNNDRASYKQSMIEASINWMQQRFHISQGTKICDFGCGPGLYATRLAAKGAQVTGIDFSKRSLQFAQETAVSQGLDIEFVHSNYLAFNSEKRFDLISLISCDFCALSPEQRVRLLHIFRQHLEDNGMVLLDVCTTAAFAQVNETARYGYALQNGFWSAEPYYGFVNTFKYEAERVSLDKYTIISADRTVEIYNWLQYFDRPALEQEFTANGLEITSWYNNVAGETYDEKSHVMAIVAQKLQG